MTQAPMPGAAPEWTLSDRLRKAREYAGLKQDEFAEETGISRRSITNYESGTREPRKPVLLMWCMRTGVSMEWLVTGKTGNGGPNGGLPRLDSNQRDSDYMSHSSTPDLGEALERRRNARASRHWNPFNPRRSDDPQQPAATA